VSAPAGVSPIAFNRGASQTPAAWSDTDQKLVGVGDHSGRNRDLDRHAVCLAGGARLRAALTATGGRGTVRIGRDPLEIETGRGGTPTSFSSAGLTPFDHNLKPDLSAPGGSILSSTLRETIGEPFAVFDGTSMAAPHVAGAAALLLQRHPEWSAPQVKSALMSTAGPAWGDTSRTTEASVLIEGAGLVNVGRADNPMVFTDPASLSFITCEPMLDPRPLRKSRCTWATSVCVL
jgi:subtilisin family serine protease